MMPSTSVRPAAIRNSITPSWTPFSSCSKTKVRVIKKGATAPFGRFSTRTSLHLAFWVVRVLVVLEDRLLDVHLQLAARALDGLQQVEVLDRVVIDVVGEPAADRVEVGLLHRRHHAVHVLQVALDR